MMEPNAKNCTVRFLCRALPGAAVLLLVVAVSCVVRIHTQAVSEKEALDKLKPVTAIKAKEGHHPVRVWLRRKIRHTDPYWLALPVTRIELVAPRDEHLQYLRALDDLRDLTITKPKITKGGFAQIHDLRELESLTLTGEPVTDVSLQQLGRLPQLRYLDLRGTGVSDVGLLHLTKFPRLEVVNLADTDVTPNGISDLREAMPRVRIELSTLEGRSQP